MPLTPDRLTRLREFGLSEYAGRAYLALLDLGIAEARDVSSLSKVPQAKIYHVLEQLHEKGLVVVLPEFPKKYAPVPFQEYLDRLYEEHTKAASTIEQARDEVAELFRVVGDTDVGDRGFFTVLRGRRNVLSKIDEMLASTKRDLVVLGTVGGAGRMAASLPPMERARERGVALRLLVPLDASTLKPAGELARLAEVRARELDEGERSAKVAIVLSDGRAAFLIHFVPDDASLVAGKDIGVFTDQEAMVAAIQAIVEPHWTRAAPFEERKAEIETGVAAPFTRIYAVEGEAWKAYGEALARGVKELRALDGYPAKAPSSEGLAVAERVRAAGGRFRAVVNLPDVASVEAHERLAAGVPGAEMRHLAPRLATRHWLLDEREAFFSLSRGPDATDLVIHTNAPAVVRTLRDHFEALWSTALPLPVRRRELEAFPLLQPGDLGLGLLFEMLGDALIVAEPDGRVLLWNAEATRIFGREPQDALGLRLGEVLEGDFNVAGKDATPRIATEGGERLLEGRALRRDGTSLDVEFTLRTVAGPGAERPLLLALVRDVTERRLARESQARFNERVIRIYESMTEAFYALDRDWRFLYRNPVTKRMASVPDEQIMGRAIWDLYPDLVGTKFHTEFHRAMQTMRPVSFEEGYPRMGRWFEVHAYPSDEGLSVYFRDVTARKQAEAAARLGETHLREAERVAGVGSWSWDARSGAVAVSEGFCRLAGADPAKAPADLEGLLAMLDPDDRDPAREALAQAAKTRAPFTLTLRLAGSDGTRRVVEAHGRPVAEGNEDVRIVMVCRERDHP